MLDTHVVVDGMNVIGSRPDGWWRDRGGAARRLHERLRRLPGPVTLVLDGRPSRDLPEGTHDGVHVLYARRKGRDAADDRIIELLQAIDDPTAVEVVTSDRDLSARARDLGATVTGAGKFLERLDAR